ncbi:MAG TPA: response regulator [Solirubrobacteraceae bacterium]|nr:response regulator [Solirubrobacteraceae bacterium]
MVQLDVELQELWVAHRGEVDASVARIEDAVSDLMAGALDDAGRDAARRAAHQLAGTVGTFGFTDASEHARVLEQALEHAPAREEALRLAELVLALRAALEHETEPLIAAGDSPGGDGHVLTPPAGPALLIVCADHLLGDALAAEAGRRGLEPIVATDPAAARRALGARPPPELMILDPGEGEWLADALALGGELGRPDDGPLAAVLADEHTDRVEVARHGCAILPRGGSPQKMVGGLLTLRDVRPRTRPSIVAIDDDPAILAAVRALLGGQDWTVSTYSDPAAVWDALESHRPDLLLLDIDMPGTTGIELCRAVRADLRWAALPVVFLTARRDAETVSAVFEVGADDFINKPIVAAELLARIANRLERTRLLRALSETDPLTSVANGDSGVAQAKHLITVAAGQGQPLAIAIASADPPPKLDELARRVAGDQALEAAAGALRRALRPEDVVARWADRELLVAVYGLSAEQAHQRITEAMGAVPRTRAGVAGYPTDGGELESLCEAAALSLKQLRETEADTTAVDVVVVEDDVVLSELLQHALKARGYSCRAIADGEEAVRALTGSQPTLSSSLVLLDWDLPGRNGLGVLRALGRAGVLNQTRVIMLTLRSGEGETLEALKLGAFDHVAKPFSVPVLMERVRRALER